MQSTTVPELSACVDGRRDQLSPLCLAFLPDDDVETKFQSEVSCFFFLFHSPSTLSSPPPPTSLSPHERHCRATHHFPFSACFASLSMDWESWLRVDLWAAMQTR